MELEEFRENCCCDHRRKILQKSTDVRVESVAVSFNFFARDFACEKGFQENGTFKNDAYNGGFSFRCVIFVLTNFTWAILQVICRKPPDFAVRQSLRSSGEYPARKFK